MPQGSLDRKCPRDHSALEAHIVPVRGPDVTVDTCPECHGLFLDKNELARVTGDAELNAFLRDKLAGAEDSPLVCPGCGGLMVVETPDGVEVDVCNGCYGIWLDGGELDALRARERGEIAITDDKRAALTDAEHARFRRHARAGPLSKVTRGIGEIARRYL